MDHYKDAFKVLPVLAHNRSLLPGAARGDGCVTSGDEQSPRIRYVAGVPSDSFSHTARAHAPIARVWAALDLPATWENIGVVDRVFDPRFEDGHLASFSFETVAAGKRYFGEANPAERLEGSVMGWRIENAEVRGTVEVSLMSLDDDRTEITVNLDVEGVGLLSTMFFPVVAVAIGSGLPRAVDQFAAGFSD